MRKSSLLLFLYLFSIHFQGFLVEGLQRDAHSLTASPINLYNLLNTLCLFIVGLSTIAYAIGSKSFVSTARGFLTYGPTRTLTLVFLLAFLSAFYSAIPLGTLYRAMPWLISLCAGIVLLDQIAKERHPLEAFERLWRLQIDITLIFVMLVYASSLPFWFPNGLRVVDGALLPYQLVGSWFQIHTNTLGFLGLMLLTNAICDKKRRGLYRAFLFTIGLSTLVFAQSRSALLASVVILFLYAFWTKDPIKLFGLAAVAIIGFVSSSFFLDFLMRGQSLEQFATLTGRTLLWERGIEFALQKPFFGHGFYSGVRYEMSLFFEEDYQYRVHGITNVDNSFVNVFIELGIVGLVVFVSALAYLSSKTIVSSLEVAGKGTNFEMLALLTLLLVKSLTGVVILFYSATQTWALFLILYCAAMERRKIVTNPLNP